MSIDVILRFRAFDLRFCDSGFTNCSVGYVDVRCKKVHNLKKKKNTPKLRSSNGAINITSPQIVYFKLCHRFLCLRSRDGKCWLNCEYMCPVSIYFVSVIYARVYFPGIPFRSFVKKRRQSNAHLCLWKHKSELAVCR